MIPSVGPVCDRRPCRVAHTVLRLPCMRFALSRFCHARGGAYVASFAMYAFALSHTSKTDVCATPRKNPTLEHRRGGAYVASFAMYAFALSHTSKTDVCATPALRLAHIKNRRLRHPGESKNPVNAPPLPPCGGEGPGVRGSAPPARLGRPPSFLPSPLWGRGVGGEGVADRRYKSLRPSTTESSVSRMAFNAISIS